MKKELALTQDEQQGLALLVQDKLQALDEALDTFIEFGHLTSEADHIQEKARTLNNWLDTLDKEIEKQRARDKQ